MTMTVPHERGFKLAAFPNAHQTKILNSYFGARRFVYNWGLAKINAHYEATKKTLSYGILSRDFTQLKKAEGFLWLNEVPATIPVQALRDLDRAMQNFFKRIKDPVWIEKARKLKPRNDGKPHYYPRFRKRGQKDHINVQLDRRVEMKYGEAYFKFAEYIRLPDAQAGKTFGKLKVRWTYKDVPLLQHAADRVPSRLTVRKLPSGKYQTSFMLRVESTQHAKAKRVCGVDLGIKSLFVTSDGVQHAPLKPFRAAQKQLAKAQRKFARQKKGSSAREKQRLCVAKIHAKIANQRKDALHKATSSLVKDYDIICIEDLNVAGMKKNRKLAKSISDTSFGEFRRQLAYKALWHGKHVEVVDQFFPSSKMCCACGTLHDMPLKTRVMSCACGNTMDRDLNAAINIKNEGMRLVASGNLSDAKRMLYESR